MIQFLCVEGRTYAGFPTPASRCLLRLVAYFPWGSVRIASSGLEVPLLTGTTASAADLPAAMLP